VAHYAVFCNLIAIMAFETIFHSSSDVMSVKVFPGSNAGMTDTALRLSVRFMGKAERLFVALAFALGIPGLFEMTKSAVSFFPRFEMTFKTTGLTWTTKRVVNRGLL